jgi:type I restriction enzyme S subunit
MGNEWKTSSLKELGVQLIDCDHKTPKALENGVPYIGIPQMDAGRINFEAKPRLISEEDFVTWTKKANPQYGDVILSRRCNSGETVYVPKEVKFALGQNLVLLRPTGDRLHPEFLRWVVHGREWWNEVAKYLNPGAIFESLKCRDIPKFKITEPPKEEQIKIANILTNISDKIELNRETNQTLETMAQALFKSWFVDFDPVFDNAISHNLANGKDALFGIPEQLLPHAQRRLNIQPTSQTSHHLFPEVFEQSDESSVGIQGWIPKGWEASNVGTTCDVTMGQSPPGSTYNEKGVGLPFFQGKTDYGFRFPKNRIYCTEPKRVANKSDTLISVRAPVGDVNMAKEQCILGRGVAAARHKSGAISYTYYLMKELESFFKVFESEGTVFGSINQKDFKALSVIDAPKKITETFELLSQRFDNKLELITENINSLESLRDTLLPKFISGELRIPDAQQSVEALVK